MNLVLLFLVCVQQAPTPPQAPTIPVSKPEQAPVIFPSYTEARAAALRTGEPLVVFVGCAARRVEGCQVCRWDAYPGGKKGIVVGVVRNGDVHCGDGDKEYLPVSARDGEIGERAREVRAILEGVRRVTHKTEPAVATPFFHSRPVACST